MRLRTMMRTFLGVLVFAGSNRYNRTRLVHPARVRIYLS
jgi:hypothetical protein